MAAGEVLRHLANDYTEPLRDPLWGTIYLTPPLEEILHTTQFQRLRGVMQLGPVSLLYPGATHTRFLHSIGVCHLGQRIVEGLLKTDHPPPLSLEGVKAFTAATLLHDLGHFPYAHSLKELPLRKHEALSAEAITADPLRRIIREGVGTDPEVVAAIIDTSLDCSIPEVGLYRKLLSGVLDPDKLDYLNRDAYFCGVPYGIQDTDFVLSKLRTNGMEPALEEGGIPAVESVLFSKYMMYQTVYWHRSVRAATGMVKKAVYVGLREGEVDPTALYGLTDWRFMSQYGTGLSAPWWSLIERVSRGELLSCALEGAFDPQLPGMPEIVGLEGRGLLEARVAEELGRVGLKVAEWDVVVDIPEEITFEFEVPVTTSEGERPYADLAKLFNPAMLDSFSRNLRKLRLFLPREVAEHLRSPQELFNSCLS